VTSVDASRPIRTSRGLACPAQAPGQVAAQAFQPVPAGPREAAGRLQLASPEPAEGGAVRVPVYLQAAQQLQLAGLSVAFSGLGGGQTPRFIAGEAGAPSLVDAAVPGMLAIAWLDGITIPRDSRLLLGWMELLSPAGAVSVPPVPVSFYSVDAVGSDLRSLVLSFAGSDEM
jgi:hypothetical protein